MRKLIILSVAMATLLCFAVSASAQFPQRRTTPNDTLQSVRVFPDGTAIFSIYAPKAREVRLSSYLTKWA